MASYVSRRWLVYSLKATVTVMLIWLVLRGVEVGEAVHHLRNLSVSTLVVVMVLLVLQGMLGAWRWTFTIKVFGSALPYLMALRLFFEGLFFNQALPSTIGGDSVRMYRCTQAGVPVSAAVNGVLLDRLGGLSGLLILVLINQPAAWQLVTEFAPRITFIAVLAVGTGAIVGLLLLASLPNSVRRWRYVSLAIELSVGARRMCRSPKLILPVLSLSLAVQVITVLVVYILARDLELSVTFWDCMVLIPLVFLAATIPVSIAGWGVREGAMVAALGLLGVSTSGAIAVSVLVGIGLFAIGLIGGTTWLVQGRNRSISLDEVDQTVNQNLKPG